MRVAAVASERLAWKKIVSKILLVAARLVAAVDSCYVEVGRRLYRIHRINSHSPLISMCARRFKILLLRKHSQSPSVFKTYHLHSATGSHDREILIAATLMLYAIKVEALAHIR